jgi:MFS family permease
MIQALRAYPRPMWLLSLGIVISAIGEAFLWPLTTLYMVQVFHKPLTLAATVLLMQYAGGLLGNLVGGMLFDKWSARKTIVSAILCSIGILVAMGFCNHFGLYVCLLIGLGFCNGMFWPGSRALAVKIWPEGGRSAINLIYVANNVGVAIGAALGGWIASTSFQWAFFGNAITYVCFLFVFVMTIKEHHVGGQAASTGKLPSHRPEKVPPATGLSAWLSMGMLIAGLALLVITYIQWQTTIPTYISSLGISLSSYSVIWAVNGLVIVVCQPLLSWLIRRFSLRLQGQIIWGAALFTASMLTISSTTSYSGFLLGMVIITLGEMLVWPGVPAIAAELAPPDRQGLFQGLVTGGQSAGRMTGPLVGSFFYEQLSAKGMLTLMVAFTLLSLCFFALYNRVNHAAQPAKTNTLSG